MGLVCRASSDIQLKICKSIQQKPEVQNTLWFPARMKYCSIPNSSDFFHKPVIFRWLHKVLYSGINVVCISGEKTSSHCDQWGKDDIWTKRFQSQESVKNYLHFIIFSQWVAKVIILKWLLITILIWACNIFIGVWWLFINLRRNIFII